MEQSKAKGGRKAGKGVGGRKRGSEKTKIARRRVGKLKGLDRSRRFTRIWGRVTFHARSKTSSCLGDIKNGGDPKREEG